MVVSSWICFHLLSSTSLAHASLRVVAPPIRRAVLVQLYDEALCTGCQEFVLQQLKPVYETLGPSFMDLQIVAFGNAQISNATDPSSLICQHDVAECDANSYLQCAMALYPTARRHFPFVVCLYEHLTMGHFAEPFDSSIFAECARTTALDWTSLQTCHDDADLAWQLQLDAASLTPPHSYVPWVVVDGQQYDMEQQQDEDFLHVVCSAYQAKNGGSVPPHSACPATATDVWRGSSPRDDDDDDNANDIVSPH